MRINELDIMIIGMKYTAPFQSYPHIIPDKVEQTKQRLQEIGIDNFNRYIVYEPQKNENHTEGFFFIGVAMVNNTGMIPPDMEQVHLTGQYVVLETIFDVSKMGEYYTKIDEWIDSSEYKHSQDRFIVEMYSELQDGSQALGIYMPVTKTE